MLPSPVYEIPLRNFKIPNLNSMRYLEVRLICKIAQYRIESMQLGRKDFHDLRHLKHRPFRAWKETAYQICYVYYDTREEILETKPG